MKALVLVGGGGLARKVLVCLGRGVKEDYEWRVKGFLDDNLHALGRYPALGPIADYRPQPEELFIMALAEPLLKKKVADILLAKGAKFATVIGSETIIADDVSVGAGSVIMTPCYIESGADIGQFVTIMGSTVGAGGAIGDYSTTTGFVNLTNAQLGQRVYVGSHAVLYSGVRVGDGAHVGVGSVVTKDVPPDTQVFGNPARAYLKK